MLKFLGLAMLAATPALAADTVIINARIHSMDGRGAAAAGGRVAQGLCIENGRITAIGSTAMARACIRPGTRVIDAQRRLVLPGLIDSHMHALSGSLADTGIDFAAADTPEKLAAALQALKAASPGSGPIQARGWQNHLFGPTGPTAAALDAVFGDRIVLIESVDGHSSWYSTAALKAGGITAATPDPVPGSSFWERDAAGHPTGTAREGADAAMARRLFAPTTAAYAAAFRRWLPRALESGLTGLFDAGMAAPDEASAYRLLAGLEAAGTLPLRYFSSTANRGEADDPVARLLQLKAQYGGRLLRPTAVKLFADGVPEGHTAFLLADYRDKADFRGVPMMTDAHLDARITAAERAGVPVHVHAIGGAAVRQVLDAVARARFAGLNGQRHAIAHMDLVDAADVPRFAKLNVVAQTSIQWATRDPSYDNIGRFVGTDVMEAAYPVKRLIASGAVQSFGTDWPAAAYLSTWKPLTQIEVAVTRRLPGRRDLPARNAAEALSVAQAVRALTFGSAYQLGVERELGSLEPGKRADLVMLDRDIFRVDPFTIAQARSLLTMVDGRVVWQAR
ncbi:MAG: amidohydrolase [Alphaproteobacteria bacterium]|nr:amidohydrolase [Alphaproteobacteria bacterium]